MSKPLIFLDVDGVLWILNSSDPVKCKPAPGAVEFIRWLEANCEVRWLTSWAITGTMREERIKDLCEIFTDIPDKIFRSFNHSNGWLNHKTEAINWSELIDREWFWIEDDLLQEEVKELDNKGALFRWLKVDVLADPNSLIMAFTRLKQLVELKS